MAFLVIRVRAFPGLLPGYIILFKAKYKPIDAKNQARFGFSNDSRECKNMFKSRMLHVLMQVLVAGIVLAAPAIAYADGPYALITGRRDPRVIVVDIGKAIDPANNGTQRAIISRV